MSRLRLVVSAMAIIASTEASGLGHLIPAVKSIPVVRYAPFYSFPNGIRSIHTVLPAVAPAVRALPPTTILPAPVIDPVLPAPPPLFPTRAVYPVAPLPPPLSFPVVTSPSAFGSAVPAVDPVYPTLPRFAPTPALSTPLFFPRAIPALPSVPFSPIIRPVTPPILPAPAPVFTPIFGPSHIGLTKTVPYPAPAPLFPAPVIKHLQAWK